MNASTPTLATSVNGHAKSASAQEQVDAMNAAGRRIQELTGKIESLSDPEVRELFQECIGSVLSFYGRGLERILELTNSSSSDFRDRLINDGVVRALLLIHGLHPVALDTRLRQALDKVRPYMESHGGSVELLGLENEVARLRLEGSCKSCASSATTLELAVRQAIEECCPDLAGFEVEGASAPSESPASERNGWIQVPKARLPSEGAMAPIHEDGMPLLVCKTRGQLYAYLDRCPACNEPLHLGMLSGDVLSCRGGHRFDACAAGRSLDDHPRSHLTPLPLLEEEGGVKIARTTPP
jgi:Fe-S cluster biogenesis protein NfuA/nitrite reductase/ring-hydroxylating ferredoxin subunit